MRPLAFPNVSMGISFDSIKTDSDWKTKVSQIDKVKAENLLCGITTVTLALVDE